MYPFDPATVVGPDLADPAIPVGLSPFDATAVVGPRLLGSIVVLLLVVGLVVLVGVVLGLYLWLDR